MIPTFEQAKKQHDKLISRIDSLTQQAEENNSMVTLMKG